MRLTYLVLLAVAFRGCSGHHDGNVVVETKALKIEPTHDIVATGLIEIVFSVNLPNMSSESDQIFTLNNCKTSMDLPRFASFCDSVAQIEDASNGILSEIANVFKSITLSFRRKRALIPFIGDIRRWVEGTATESELNQVIKTINKLGHNVETLSQSNHELINATRINAVQLQYFHGVLESRLKNLTSAINNVFSEVSDAQLQADNGRNRLLAISVLHSKINLLETHLMAVSAIFDSCKSNKLSSVAVSPNSLITVLLAESRKLSEAQSKFIFDLPSVLEYYKLSTAHCQLISSNNLKISLSVPITSARNSWHVLSFSPLKFLVSNLTCSMFPNKVTVATDGLSIRDISFSLPLKGTNVYILPRFHSPSKLPKCISILVHDANILSIRKHCPLNCIHILESTVEILNKTSFTILNPSVPVHIICSSRVMHQLQPISDGRYEVSLPCHCVAQDISSNGDVLIPSHGPCVSPSSINITNDWAGANFSTLNLFVPHHRVALALDENVTLPPLHVVTPSPLPNGNVWHDMPMFTSGKIETLIFSSIGFAALIVLAYTLESKLKLFSRVWRGISFLWTCCVCRSENHTPPKYQPSAPKKEESVRYYSRSATPKDHRDETTTLDKMRSVAQSTFSLDQESEL